MSHLLNTVSYPVMNLVLNLEAEARNLKSERFLDFERQAQKMRLWAVIHGPKYLPMFAPHHLIQPQPAVISAQ